MSIFKKKNIEYNLLDLTPMSKYSFIEETNGTISVIIPRFKNKFILKHFGKRMKNPNVKLKLDEIGSSVFREVNGENKVEQIANKLVESFGDRIQPVNDRISLYFKQLYDNNIIYFKEL